MFYGNKTFGGKLWSAKEFPETFEKWCRYRRELGKPVTNGVINRAYRAFRGHPPHAVINAINRAIKNGWRGVFINEELDY